MSEFSDDFLKATSAKIGDNVYVVMKKDDGRYDMTVDVIEALDFSHGSAKNAVYAGTTRSGYRFALVDKTGEIPGTTNKICQIFRDVQKVQDFLDAEREQIEASYQDRMESINAISLSLRKA